MDEGSVLAIPLNDTKKQHPWRIDGDYSNTVIVPVHTYLSNPRKDVYQWVLQTSLSYPHFWNVAQLVEQVAVNHSVGGSNPFIPANGCVFR